MLKRWYLYLKQPFTCFQSPSHTYSSVLLSKDHSRRASCKKLPHNPSSSLWVSSTCCWLAPSAIRATSYKVTTANARSKYANSHHNTVLFYTWMNTGAYQPPTAEVMSAMNNKLSINTGNQKYIYVLSDQLCWSSHLSIYTCPSSRNFHSLSFTENLLSEAQECEMNPDSHTEVPKLIISSSCVRLLDVVGQGTWTHKFVSTCN